MVYEGRRLPFASLQDLKKAIKNTWKEVTIETIRKSIAQWKKRLNAVGKQHGGAVTKAPGRAVATGRVVRESGRE